VVHLVRPSWCPACTSRICRSTVSRSPASRVPITCGRVWFHRRC